VDALGVRHGRFLDVEASPHDGWYDRIEEVQDSVLLGRVLCVPEEVLELECDLSGYEKSASVTAMTLLLTGQYDADIEEGRGIITMVGWIVIACVTCFVLYGSVRG